MMCIILNTGGNLQNFRVMPGLMPGIHALLPKTKRRKKDVDGRDKPDHDEERWSFRDCWPSAGPHYLGPIADHLRLPGQ
jgi:hypothetical protein